MYNAIEMLLIESLFLVLSKHGRSGRELIRGVAERKGFVVIENPFQYSLDLGLEQ